MNCHREIDKPESILFEELGWDRDPANPKEKHYRKFTDQELEHTKEIMSKPSEFHCYELKRGQARGASTGLFSFGGGKKDASSGELDTTQKMGLFKALITVSHKDTAEEKANFIKRKLQVILQLLGEIYVKKNKKPFPIAPGFFCEADGNFEGSKVMTVE